MIDREKLTKTIRAWIDDLLSGNGFGDDYSGDELDAWVAEALAVFEKAHTPTDNEREARLREYVTPIARTISEGHAMARAFRAGFV